MRFDFRRIGLCLLENHLTSIAQKEGIVINTEAISLIAKHSQGGLRDAESLLDQVSLLAPPITQSNIINLIGAVPEEELIKLAKSLIDKDPNSILNICNHLINNGKEPIAILQGIASILRDLVVTKVINEPNDLCDISQENRESLDNLAKSINLDQVISLQAKLKGSENIIRSSNQPKLWLEINLLGMLSNENHKQVDSIKQSFTKTTVSNNFDNKNDILKNIGSNKKKEKIQEIPIQENSRPNQDINLDQIWKKVIAMLELPSTKMLLSQQAKLINLNSDSAEIAISEKWINMIQSRKNLIEEAFYKARGSSTKVFLIQQKDDLSNHRKDEQTEKQIKPKNEFKLDKENNTNILKDNQKIKSKNDFDKNSIDEKAKQFADFFSGEIVNLE
tara:strand:- start:263 stop:1435 length:1173 start_codon:yes stop_codon:yes gene_type:complete